MKHLTLNNLYNPAGINAVLLKSGNYVEAMDNQGWQEYPNCIELWQKMDDGRLLRVKRWYRKSIVALYNEQA